MFSPFNKREEGLSAYQEKRRRILLSNVHLIEIDLLRGGQRPGWEVAEPSIETDYILLVNRAGRPERRPEIWSVNLNESLPILPVPLLPPDPDVALEMQVVFDNIYQRAVYARCIDYSQSVPPNLRENMEEWLKYTKIHES